VSSWRRLDARPVARCHVFDVDAVRFAPESGGAARSFHVVSAPDWVNVVPLTDEGRILLVRQFRFGIEAETLEIPGGMCDPGETPVEAARRELGEETGCVASAIEPLGWVHPNPPLQSNRCFSFLARGVTRAGEPRPDPDERIETVEIPLADIPRWVEEGAITHALVLAALYLLDRREGR
jgi:8-oxo-dGTP pyrophosphatase MutT (NUDIX family)